LRKASHHELKPHLFKRSPPLPSRFVHNFTSTGTKGRRKVTDSAAKKQKKDLRENYAHIGNITVCRSVSDERAKMGGRVRGSSGDAHRIHAPLSPALILHASSLPLALIPSFFPPFSIATK
jgi:hypothetical protein